jgi:hypothetical protein
MSAMLTCIAYYFRVPHPTIMVQLGIPSTGGFLLYPWIIAILMKKGVPAPRHKSILQVHRSVVLIRGTTPIPNLLLCAVA